MLHVNISVLSLGIQLSVCQYFLRRPLRYVGEPTAFRGRAVLVFKTKEPSKQVREKLLEKSKAGLVCGAISRALACKAINT